MTEQINYPLSNAQRSQVGYSPWGQRNRHNWVTNTHTHTHTHTQPHKRVIFCENKSSIINHHAPKQKEIYSFNQKDNKCHKYFICKKNFI